MSQRVQFRAFRDPTDDNFCRDVCDLVPSEGPVFQGEEGWENPSGRGEQAENRAFRPEYQSGTVLTDGT